MFAHLVPVKEITVAFKQSVTDLVHVRLCVSHRAWQITTVLMLKDAFRAC